MTKFDIFLLVFWVLSILINIAMVGRPRQPITPGVAGVSTLILGAMIFGLLASRGVL